MLRSITEDVEGRNSGHKRSPSGAIPDPITSKKPKNKTTSAVLSFFGPEFLICSLDDGDLAPGQVPLRISAHVKILYPLLPRRVGRVGVRIKNWAGRLKKIYLARGAVLGGRAGKSQGERERERERLAPS